MWDPYAEFQSTVLPNGLTVYGAHWPKRSEVIGFVVHAGAFNDPVGLEGLAHFVEHVIHENTGFYYKGKELSIKELDDLFGEKWGGKIVSASTGYFGTFYKIRLPLNRRAISSSLSIVSKILFQAQFKNKIEEERRIIIEEFYQRFPLAILFEDSQRVSKALNYGTWVERCWNTLGTPQSISMIGQNDLQKFYDEHYVPANLSIVGVGGLSFNELVSLILESGFDFKKEGKRNPLPTPKETIGPPLENKIETPLSEIYSSKCERPRYKNFIRIPGIVKPSLVIFFNYILEDLLFKEMRERGWSYDLTVRYENYISFYTFALCCCDTLSPEALSEIDEVIRKCLDQTCEEILFERKKRVLIKQEKLVDLSAGDLCGNAMRDVSYFHRIITLSELIKEIEEISIEKIKDFVSQWCKPEMQCVVIQY